MKYKREAIVLRLLKTENGWGAGSKTGLSPAEI
jgi:hypothetical protein